MPPVNSLPLLSPFPIPEERASVKLLLRTPRAPSVLTTLHHWQIKTGPCLACVPHFSSQPVPVCDSHAGLHGAGCSFAPEPKRKDFGGSVLGYVSSSKALRWKRRRPRRTSGQTGYRGRGCASVAACMHAWPAEGATFRKCIISPYFF